jgi:DNA modification methylase
MVIPLPDPRRGRARRPTSTARFGSSRRESHDASAFYDRFTTPDLSADTTVRRPKQLDIVYNHDARHMGMVESSSVALVVTSPPYFAGKEYEQSLGQNGVPGTYFDYLALLSDVFEECERVLEPGGRIAVNVANLGRRPYRSLAGDVTDILQRLGLLLRGEVVWWKGRAAGGSCAWGTFQSPSNPVLRDVTERIVIASKGRFDRAVPPPERRALHLPSTASITRDEFLEATTDLWEIAPESATRVGHPAPFPVELPARLIELYTYEDDVVLDPFMGSGSTAVAAIRTHRRFVGFDTDEAYVDRSLARVTSERDLLERERRAPPRAIPRGDRFARAVDEGRQAREAAGILLAGCGFVDIRTDVKLPGLGIELSFLAKDQTGAPWGFDVAGGFTSGRTGLRKADTLWRAVGKAAVLHQAPDNLRLVLLTTGIPAKGSAGYRALNVVKGPGRPVFDVIDLLNIDDRERLRTHAVTASRAP